MRGRGAKSEMGEACWQHDGGRKDESGAQTLNSAGFDAGKRAGCPSPVAE